MSSPKLKVVCTGRGAHREKVLFVFADQRRSDPITREQITTLIDFERYISPDPPPERDADGRADAILRNQAAGQREPGLWRRRWRTTKAGKRVPGADLSENMRVIDGKRGTSYEFTCCQGPVRIRAQRIFDAFDTAQKTLDCSYLG